MGGRCPNRERAIRSARGTVQGSGWKIRRAVQGLGLSAFTITKSQAGQPRKSSKGHVVGDRTKTLPSPRGSKGGRRPRP
jgi:hypothetical protein